MIGFLILHYNAIDVTKKCVESIQQIDMGNDAKIVIVDNHSENNSGQELQELYKDVDNITVLLLEGNLGFSKGNNIGYEYLKQYTQLDFLVVTNNDIIFHQKDFIKKIINIYEKTPFYVLGPDVWAIYKHEHQSPIADKPKSIEEVDNWLKQIRRWKRSIYIDTVLNFIIGCVNDTKIYKKYRELMDRKFPPRKIIFDKVQEDKVLLGACLIFSKDFIEKNSKLFEPETFFYNEEEILAEKCRRNNWKALYDPSIQVHHLEGVATRKKAAGYFKRQKFLYENFENAALIYKDFLLKKGGEND